MKNKTGVVVTKKEIFNDDYGQLLQNKETAKYCSEFSSSVFRLSNDWSDVQESRKTIKDKVAHFMELEQNNKIGLLEYLEHLILDNHNFEFIIPYYVMSDGNVDNQTINNHLEDCFGMLGNVDEITS